MSRVPAIRFKGFADPWEQRKLGDVVTPYSDPVSTPHDGYTRLGVRSHAKGTFLGRVDPGKELETAQMHRVAADNLIVNITFAWEHAVAITRAGDANALVSHRFPQYSFNDGQVPKFYEYLIKDERFRHHLWLASPGGAGRNRVLKTSEMLEYELFAPAEVEQKRIGAFFASLDNLITLHQRKHDRLVVLKKALLEKLFPRGGKTVPEIRFAGFTDSWEQRKLGDVVTDFYCGQTPYRQNELYWNGMVNWLASGDLNRNLVAETAEKITEYGKESTGLRVVPKGTVVIATMGQEAPLTRGNCGILGIDSTINQACMALFVDKDTVDNDFLFQWYKSVGNAYGLRYTQGTKQQNYNAETLSKLDIALPSIEEQRQIGASLCQLDNLITFHQRKLELLRNLKAACLDKMFV